MSTNDNLLTDDGRIDFPQLAIEVGEWSTDQFGDQPPRLALKGAIEELGELCHSDLKREQGIRLDDDDVGVDAERDAVGDVVIYLADFVYRHDACQVYDDWSLDDVADKTSGKDAPKDHLLGLVGWWLADSLLVASEDSEFHVQEGIWNALAHLRQYCDHVGYDFDRCVYEAWVEEVSDREWDAEVTA